MGIRVLIADDHPVVRMGVAGIIRGEPDMEVAGEAADGDEAIRLAKATKPDVATLDLEMPGTGGIEAIEALRDASPKTRVIALTVHTEPEQVRAVIAAGGVGYVVKSAVGPELVAAIRAVHAGESYIKVPLSARELQGIISGEGGDGTVDPLARLTPREREVFRLLARGFTNAEIAGHISLSPKTVGTYRARIGEKLGLQSRAEIVALALEIGALRADG